MLSFKEFCLLQEEDKYIPSYFDSDESFREYWKSKGVDNTVIKFNNYIRPNDIRIDKQYRNLGLGTKFMIDLCKFSDYYKLPIRITPSKDFGASSIPRLINFYKRFGFIENKGRNKDFSFRETMYRIPTEFI